MISGTSIPANFLDNSTLSQENLSKQINSNNKKPDNKLSRNNSKSYKTRENPKKSQNPPPVTRNSTKSKNNKKSTKSSNDNVSIKSLTISKANLSTVQTLKQDNLVEVL